MPKEKNRKADRKKKAGKKGSQLAIRVERSERDAFVALCDRLDTSAAREIRRFMREFVAAHAATETPTAEPTPADAEPPAAEAAPAPKRRRPARAKSAAAEEPAPEAEPAAAAPKRRRPRQGD